ncbi:unnamed protein product [Effrenium voratum]|nr:unnamed protein product [Effrenium voratum]
MGEAGRDEEFERLCQLCRAQHLEHTAGLAIAMRSTGLAARRSAQARRRSPEHLHLDRRQLGRCPVLEEEGMLRLLNYQNNAITRIENLDGLPHLAFLDLYDNKIQHIESLDSCKNLRVLMLGKNQIQRLENLRNLEKLDVLDLHSNRIKEIQNIRHLKQLRVLNLAGNLLQQVTGLEGLSALVELNIRRNAITSLSGLERVPQLQRLFASHNHIVTQEGLRALSSMTNLREVSMDGNPVVEAAEVYRAHIASLCPALEILDNAKVDHKSLASPATAKASAALVAPEAADAPLEAPRPEKEKEIDRSASFDRRHLSSRSPHLVAHKRMTSREAAKGVTSLAVSSAGLAAGPKASFREELPKAPQEQKAGSMTSDEVLQAIKEQWADVLKKQCLMTRHGYVKRGQASELSIFGRGLDALEKIEYQTAVTSICFQYIMIGVLVNEVARLAKFQDLSSITFVQNEITSPQQLEAFQRLRLRSLTIKDNPICRGRANLRVNILRWLPQLRKIDELEVQDYERVEAQNLRDALPVVAAESPTNRKDTEDMVQQLLSHACEVDSRISAAHLHFEHAVEQAIREVWLDLHTERHGTSPAMPLLSSGPAEIPWSSSAVLFPLGGGNRV